MTPEERLIGLRQTAACVHLRREHVSELVAITANLFEERKRVRRLLEDCRRASARCTRCSTTWLAFFGDARAPPRAAAYWPCRGGAGRHRRWAEASRCPARRGQQLVDRGPHRRAARWAAGVAVSVRGVGGAGSGSSTPEKVDAAELAVLLAADLGCGDRRPVRLHRAHRAQHRQAVTGWSSRRSDVAEHLGLVCRGRRGTRSCTAPGWLQKRCTAGVPLRAVAAEVGCSVTMVRAVADRLGVERRRRALRRPQLRDVAWLRQAYLERGLSLGAIACEVGASDSAVSRALARAEVPTRPIARQLRLADADWLRSVYLDDGLAAPEIADRTAASIAAEVGRSASTVKQALAGHGIQHKQPPPRPSKRQLVEDWGRRGSITALAEWYGGAGDAPKCGSPRPASSCVRDHNSHVVPCGLGSVVATMS